MLFGIFRPANIWQGHLVFVFLIALAPFYVRGQASETDSLRSLLHQNQEAETRLDLLEQLAKSYLRIETDSSQKYYQQALALAREIEDVVRTAEYAKNLGTILLFRHDYENALRLLDEALKIFRANHNSKEEAYIISNLGILADMKGDYKEAAEQFQKSKTLSETIDDKEGIARAENNLAMVFQTLGRYDDALAALLHALDIAEKESQFTRTANTLNNIARLHIEQEHFEESLVYARRALSTTGAKNDLYLVSLSYSNLGSGFTGLGQWDSALFYLEKQIVTEKKLEDEYSAAEALISIGQVYQAKEDWGKADDSYQQALDIFEQSKNKVGLASVSFAFGKLFLEQKQYTRAMGNLKQALSSFQDLSMKGQISSCYELLAETYHGLGQEKQAFQWLQKHIALKDTLLNEARIETLANMEERYETAKKEKSILELETANTRQALNLTRQKWIIGVSLISLFFLMAFAFFLYRNNRERKKKNQILAIQKTEIERQNERNQLLLKEIHHRVKNNLQTISSLLRLQSTHLDDESVREAVAEGQHRVESMALIHQKLYQRESLAGIEMKDYLRNLGESLFSTYGIEEERIVLNIEMEELELDVDTAVPIGLIVNELLTNSLKYAFPAEATGEVRIALDISPSDTLHLRVSDNGKGMKANETIQGTGFGSRLIRLLSIQLRGEMTLNTENGFNVEFEFKNSKASRV